MTDSIRCDVSAVPVYGLPDEVFADDQRHQSGWVCRQCRTQIDGLQIPLLKLMKT